MKAALVAFTSALGEGFFVPVLDSLPGAASTDVKERSDKKAVERMDFISLAAV